VPRLNQGRERAILSKLEERLTRIEAHREISDVIYRFCRAVDRSDLDAIPPLFHEGAVDNHGFYEGGVPGLVEWLRDRHRNILNASHNVSSLLIEFAGPDRALVESRVTVCIRYNAEGGAAFAKAAGLSLAVDRDVDVLSFARYVDIFERCDGLWKIASRTGVPEQSLFFEVPDGTDITSPITIMPRRDQGDLVFRLRRELGIARPPETGDAS
jgi:SnoaL-like domain